MELQASHLIAGLALTWGLVSTLVAWAFASGKFAGRTVTAEMLSEKIAEEHRYWRERVDKLDANDGVLQTHQAVLQEQVKAIEKRVDGLERRSFIPGGLGV